MEDPIEQWVESIVAQSKPLETTGAEDRDSGGGVGSTSTSASVKRQGSASNPASNLGLRCLAVPSREVSGKTSPRIPEDDSVVSLEPVQNPPGCVGDSTPGPTTSRLHPETAQGDKTPLLRPTPLHPVGNAFSRGVEDDELKLELASIHRKLDLLLGVSELASPKHRRRRRSLVMGIRKAGNAWPMGRMNSDLTEAASPGMVMAGASKRPSLQDVLTVRRPSMEVASPKPPEIDPTLMVPTASTTSAQFAHPRQSQEGKIRGNSSASLGDWDRIAIEMKKQQEQQKQQQQLQVQAQAQQAQQHLHPIELPKAGEPTGPSDDEGAIPALPGQSEKQSRMHLMLEARRRKACSAFLDKLWRFLEDPESSSAARSFDKAVPWFIMFTVCVSLLQTPVEPPISRFTSAIMETAIDCIYLAEFVARVVSCPNHRALFASPFTVVDIAASVPLFFRAAVGFILPDDDVRIVVFALLYVVPIVRLLKMLRRFEKLHLLVRAFQVSLEVLPALIFILFTLALVFCVIIYKLENRDNMPSLPDTFWFTIVTMTTLGYGDVTPQSGEAQFACGVLVVTTMLYMSIPLGVLGSAFSRTWDDRDRILLMKRTRDRLRQWGYNASDIPVLFSLCDTNQDGELSIFEFRNLIKHMQIGFSDERIFQLFHSFDHDLSGTVDDREFVRALFPYAYHDIYQAEEDEDPTHSMTMSMTATASASCNLTPSNKAKP
eukprot:CAMPEP_0178423950 /NCGR_PEP_ID=MMETSP0689_2-20121128/27953_1 /TAXON_ID=160604 /ORGANISM="Amphidinium massartii, Strain CS-259" /LENGTH=716 /DNA_ID=CAMNT_0020045561 /DNA_START=9 /DNA_END=2155 /DNA_ORIENTATION=+